MEIVEQEIERVLPAFRAAMHCELLQEEEVKVLLQDRKREEAKLIKRNLSKDDFINFVARDSIMLKLLQKRRKKVNYNHKMAEIEYIFLQRLNRILRRAHRLWPDDENVWKTHICLLEKWNKRTQLSKLYEEYVAKYPHKVGAWLEAARFQLERNGSADQARKLLYRAQQNIPDQPIIFDQLFRVELINASLLRKRLEVTGSLEENEGMDLIDGLAAIKVAEIANKNFPDNGSLILSMISVSKSAAMSFEKVTAHLVELLLKMNSANGISARADYLMRYESGGIKSASGLFREALDSERDDKDKILFNFLKFASENKLEDDVKFALERSEKLISDLIRIPTCFLGGNFVDLLIENGKVDYAYAIQTRIVDENANKIEEKAFLARIIIYHKHSVCPKALLTECMKADNPKIVDFCEKMISEWAAEDSARLNWFSSISAAGKIYQIRQTTNRQREMILRYSSCKPINTDFTKLGLELLEKDEEKMVFAENCCKNWPKAETYFELLKLAQRVKLNDLGGILTRAKGNLEDGEYDRLHQLWQYVKAD